MTQKRGIDWLICILFSLITGLAISAMYFTGGTIDKFFDEGDVLEISYKDMNMTLTGMVYSEEDQRYTVTEEQAVMYWQSFTTENVWKFIKIDLTELTKESIRMKLGYYTMDNIPVGEGYIDVKDGGNWIQLKQNAFSYIVVSIEDEQGSSFGIDHVKLYTEFPDTTVWTVVRNGLLYACICLLICSVLSIGLHKLGYSPDWYALTEGIQKLYLLMAGILFRNELYISEKKRRRLRIGLFVLLFVVLSFLNVYDYYFKVELHRYIMLFFVVVLFAEAILYQEGDMKVQNWRNPFVRFWLLQWIMVCISDFIIAKRNPFFSFYGYIMLFVMGFLFFVWSNREDGAEIRREICVAVEWTFWLCTIYCLACRPEAVGFRYNGFYNNPNPFGLYMAVVVCIFLSELDFYIKGKKHWICMLFYAAGIEIAVFFLYKTQCTTGIAALGAAGLFWFFGYFRRGIKGAFRKRFVKTVLILAVALVPFFGVMQWGINTLPYLFHTSLSYPGELNYVKADVNILPEMGEIVYAAEPDTVPELLAQEQQEVSAVERIVQKLENATSLNVLLSGRIYNYIAYIRDMNLFGHTRRPIAYGTYTNYAHNGFLAYAHVYGVYILIPYILANFYYFYYAMRHRRQYRKATEDSFLPIAVFIIFFLENMMDNVDVPFHWIVWFVFVMIGGTLFRQDDGLQSGGTVL